MNVLLAVLVAGVAYFGGSIPTGLLVSRWVRGVDIRGYGSGNIGTTNVLRVIGAGWAVLVFVLDAAKGALPQLLGRYLGLSPLALALVGILSVAGHNWSVFLRFRGGKGVATSLGALLAISPLSAVGAALVWLITVVLTGYSSLGSMLGLASSGPLLYLLGEPKELVFLGGAFLVMTLWQHRANIKRLAEGKELRFTQKISVANKNP